MADLTPYVVCMSLSKEVVRVTVTTISQILNISLLRSPAMAQAAIEAIEAGWNDKRTNWIRMPTNHRKARLLMKMSRVKATGYFHPTNLGELGLFRRSARYVWLFPWRSYDLEVFDGSHIAELYVSNNDSRSSRGVRRTLLFIFWWWLFYPLRTERWGSSLH